MEGIINIVDAICGSGKTSAAINFINQSDDDKHFLYITPYLDEVERIIKSCPDKHFVQPQNYGSKLHDIKRLFEQGRNIVSTHALFSMFDEEIADIVLLQGYTLIMDEVADVVEPLDISEYDLDIILSNYATVVNGHLLQWTEPNYTGELDKYKKMIELDAVYYYSKTALLWLFPVSAFKAFDKIFILTYMFDSQIQRYYYDFYGLAYNYLYVEGDSVGTYKFSQQKTQSVELNYNNLIHILDHDKLNRLGEAANSLSKTWYIRNKNNGCMKEIQKAMINFFNNIAHTPSKQNLWTVFKEFKPILSGKGYAKGFLACNARATNNYRQCISLAYVVNRYMLPVVKNFFIENGIRVEEDQYALSELIQWIFRSALRDGKEITLYIPSRRMRTLLEDWITKQN